MREVPLQFNVFSPNKLFSHMDRMHDWWQGKRIYPITMELSPSSVCNHYCTWCMHGAYFGKHRGDEKIDKPYPDSSIMPFSFYRTLVDELVEVGAKAMIFSGSGEPFVNREFPKFIEYTAKSGMDVAVITNGSLMDDEGIEMTARYVSWMRISLDSGTAAGRMRIHRTPEKDWENTLENMRRVANAKKAEKSSLHLGSQIVVCPENWEEIDQCAQVSKECGMDYLQIKPAVLHPMSSNKQYEEEFFKRALATIYETKARYEDESFRVFVKDDQFAGVLAADYEKGHYRKCYADFFPIIEANKLVYYCSQTRGLPQFAIGDLSKNTFKEIWESEHRKLVNDCIDVMKCQPICRCHQVNKTLWSIRHPSNKPNFV